MTRSERRELAEKKRKAYCLWIFDTLKARFDRTKDWEGSIDWLSRRIDDKITEIPQEKELIIEATKMFRDKMNERQKEAA